MASINAILYGVDGTFLTLKVTFTTFVVYLQVMMVRNASATIFPCLFCAVQLYRPSSAHCKLEITRCPEILLTMNLPPFLISVTAPFSAYFTHDILGIGIPLAVHSKKTVALMFSDLFSGLKVKTGADSDVVSIYNKKKNCSLVNHLHC